MNSNQQYITEAIYQVCKNNYSTLTHSGISVERMMRIRFYWRFVKDETLNELLNTQQADALDTTINYIATHTKSIKPTPIAKMIVGAKKLLGKKINPLSRQDLNRKRILVHIENVKHYSYLKPVVEQLTMRGYEVIFFSFHKHVCEAISESILIQLDDVYSARSLFSYYHPHESLLISSLEKILFKYRPFAVLLAEGDSVRDEVIAQLCRKHNITSICMQWGYFGTVIPKMGWLEMSFSKMLFWGDFFRKGFMKYSPNLKAEIVGHPTLKLVDRVEKKSVILFAVQKPMLPFITPQDIEAFITEALTATTLVSGFSVRIRTHPDFKLDDSRIKALLDVAEVHHYDTHSLAESLADAAYCVSISSTVNLEAVNYGCVPIYMKLTKHHFAVYRDITDMQAGLVVKNTEDLLAQLKGLNKVKTYNSLPNHFYKAAGNEAVENIVTAILSDQPIS